MELHLENRFFIVCGATSGFGMAIAQTLLNEGSKILAIARGEEKLNALKHQYPDQVTIFSGDLTQTTTIDSLEKLIDDIYIDGVVVNASGPPVRSALDTTMEDWDNAYKTLVRWKIDFLKRLLPKFNEQQYGRIVFIESSSVKQPVENLILSTSMRLAMVGFAKTLSQEVAKCGITVNVMAPGYHDTPALERIFKNSSNTRNISEADAKKNLIENVPVQKLGDPNNFAVLAGWLLSPLSDFVTGQVLAVDGGVIKSTL